MNPPAKHLLVIEDNAEVRENLVWLLEASGYAVRSAADGREGLERARAHPPDLILCDVMMPELDGLGVLRALRSEASTATIPFVFLTARADREDLRAGMAAGADDYITKPFSTREVLAAVEARLQKQEALHEQQESRLDELRLNISRALPHELRTPLVAVIGFSEILREDWEALGPHEGREMAQHIYAAGRRLERTVENYGAFAELTLAASDPEARAGFGQAPAVEAGGLVRAEAERVARSHERPGDLCLDVTEAGCRVPMREEHLRKAVHELVDNAFRYSRPGTPVTVRVDGSARALEVVDEGRGMQPDEVRRIGGFLQFGRARHEDQGSGLGLAIVERLGRLYGGGRGVGGGLGVESQPGLGTTARFALPSPSRCGGPPARPQAVASR